MNPRDEEMLHDIWSAHGILKILEAISWPKGTQKHKAGDQQREDRVAVG